MNTEKNNTNLLENTHFQDKEKKLSHSPLVSIIVPIYNVEKYLRQCLDSIITQTLKDIEIILVNDGSTDNCGVICDEYALKDKRIQVVHKTNAGLGAAYNTGLEMASGEYIGFVESDDWIEPNMYKELYTKAKETDVDVCIGNFYYHSDMGDRIYQQLFTIIPYGLIFSISDYPELLTLHTSLWAKIYKKSVLGHIRVPEFKNSGYYCDFPYWTEILCYAKTMTRINSCIYHYRTDNPNASSTNLRTDSKLLTIIPSIEETKNIIKKYNKYDLLKEEVYFNSILTAFRFFANIDKQYKQEFFEKMKVFVEDLRLDDTFTFKYFLNSGFLGIYRKKFVLSLLNNDYKKAIELSHYVNNNAVNRVKNHLSYQIGYILVHQTKTFKEILKLPFSIFKAIRVFKKQQKELKETNLPKLKEYPDYQEALKIQNHLSYKIGKVFVNMNFLSFLLMPFKIYIIYKNHYKQKDRNDFENKILKKIDNLGTMLYEVRSDLLASVVHPNIFGRYKNIYKEKDIVILGNGPSVKDYQPITNAVHIGTNRAFFLKNIKLDYLFVQHTLYPEGNDLLEHFCKENKDVQCFLGYLPATFNNNNSHYKHPPKIYYECSNVNPYFIRKQGNLWAHDLSVEAMADFVSVIFAALQFACYTNPKRIYLVGCDCSQGHFYEADFYKEHQLTGQINTWYHVSTILKKWYPHIEVISVNPIGLEGLFKDIYTNSN
ncbi:glycosyltransferase family 2 protein [Campylobacter coli]|uniref:glycosyltransferase family 2 protein n=1 Tax=Campylobacter coli TaxID=195 RepID=UPI0009305146|nr:glycosyltransferase [Campylobacter coli]